MIYSFFLFFIPFRFQNTYFVWEVHLLWDFLMLVAACHQLMLRSFLYIFNSFVPSTSQLSFCSWHYYFHLRTYEMTARGRLLNHFKSCYNIVLTFPNDFLYSGSFFLWLHRLFYPLWNALPIRFQAFFFTLIMCFLVSGLLSLYPLYKVSLCLTR